MTATVFALAGYDSDDVLELWALPKQQALERLAGRHPDAEGPALARRFYDNVRSLYGGAFDAVIDFEAALGDPEHPTRMLPVYDCGDHLHPSDAGYLRMGDIIDLALFD